MYEEYKEPLYAAPPLLQRMVDAGRLGRKSGSGFYTYPDERSAGLTAASVAVPTRRSHYVAARATSRA